MRTDSPGSSARIFGLFPAILVLAALIAVPLHASKTLSLKNTANGRTAEVPVVTVADADFVPAADLGRACRFLYEFDRVTRKALLQNETSLGQLMPGSEYICLGMDVLRCTHPPVMSGGGVCVAVEDTASLLKGLGLANWESSLRLKQDDPAPQAPGLLSGEVGTSNPTAIIREPEEAGTEAGTERPSICPVHRPDGENQLRFIVLDPGHGGTDPGGIGLTGLREKIVVLKISLMVKALLEEQLPGVRVMLTRDRNDFVSLEDRGRMANDALKTEKNGVFISIHANISLNKQTSGVETYFLSDNPSDDEARAVAAAENGVIGQDGAPAGVVNMLLSSMLDAELIRQSRLLAEAVNGGFCANLGSFTGSRGLKTARFRVLERAMMPSILTEVGFLSNAREEKLLRDDEYLARVALAISEGIVGFARQYNKHNGFTI